MAKRKSGLVEELFGLAATLPWWLGVLLAIGSYIGLHLVTTMDVQQPVGTAGLGAFGVKSLYKALAYAGQFVLPIAFLGGAIASVIRRRKREKLLEETAENAEPNALNGMSWQEFEMLVGEAYRRQGFSVRETGGGGADGGVDLVLTKNGQTVLVQCKQWKTFKVGVKTVRELYGVMAAQKAQGGVVVSSGVFTQEAKDFAAGKNIALIDGEKLRRVIESVRATPHPTSPANASQVQVDTTDVTPTCPKCGAAMVKRTAKQGENAGRSFWGCSTYPACRGIVPIEVVS